MAKLKRTEFTEESERRTEETMTIHRNVGWYL